jgi:hypothetical protein
MIDASMTNTLEQDEGKNNVELHTATPLRYWIITFLTSDLVDVVPEPLVALTGRSPVMEAEVIAIAAFGQ